MVSGLLVGIGSTLAGGEIFGHVLCGLPRFSIRSIFATLLIGGSAVYAYRGRFTRVIAKHSDAFAVNLPSNIDADTYLLISLLVPFVCFIFSQKKSLRALIEHLLMFVIGMLSGLSLMVGGLTQLKDYDDVLDYERNWDPSILFYFATAIAINFLTFNFLIMTK